MSRELSHESSRELLPQLFFKRSHMPFRGNDMYSSHNGQVDIAANVQPDNVEFIWNLRGIRIHIHSEQKTLTIEFPSTLFSVTYTDSTCTLSINLIN
ncbi:hypothetical protein CFP56_033482 [Quercus suber]|uniref:Uncharacterized protein n=1 Tax=Quercus suber TaxID=58331 RepID=A0AAW0JEL8_QUESU